jgi:hypothetical protein
MRMFAFGNMHEVDGGTVGEYALHIQCPWRIDGPSGIVTGRSDLWEATSGAVMPDEWEPGFDDNVQDVALANLLGASDATTNSHVSNGVKLVVERVDANDIGDLVLTFSGGYRLVIFPSGTVGEAWRLFQPGTETPHLVVEGGSVIFE